MDPSDITLYLTVGAILFAASTVQGTVGFAAGLFGIPLLVLFGGVETPEAIMTMLLASLIQNLGGVFKLWREIDFREMIGPILIRLFFIPLGVLALRWAVTLPPQNVKAILGGVLLMLVLLQWFFAPTHAMKLHAVWSWVAFSASGFLVGFCGMGGPPMVLWVMAQPWSSAKSRAFLFTMFLSSLVPHVLLLNYTFGKQIGNAGIVALISTPWIIAGTWLGLYLGSHLPKRRLRPLVYVVLIITAAVAMASPLVP